MRPLRLSLLMGVLVLSIFLVVSISSNAYTIVQAGKFNGEWLLYYDNEKVVKDPAGFSKILGNEKVCHKYSNYRILQWEMDSSLFNNLFYEPRKSTVIKIEMIDPSGVIYSSTGSKKFGYYYDSHDGEWLTAPLIEWDYVPCPDYSRPGYWKFIVVDTNTSEIWDEITFYVPPKENKGFSVQAICGPASIAGLALLPLGILGVKRRRNR